MQHIEIDQFSQWSVAVVESPAQAAPFSICLRCCLNRSLIYPDNFISCVYRFINTDEDREVWDGIDMHHASYQLALSSTHHLGILSSLRRHSDFTRRRLCTPCSTVATLGRVLVHLSRLSQQIAVF